MRCRAAVYSRFERKMSCLKHNPYASSLYLKPYGIFEGNSDAYIRM